MKKMRKVERPASARPATDSWERKRSPPGIRRTPYLRTSWRPGSWVVSLGSGRLQNLRPRATVVELLTERRAEAESYRSLLSSSDSYDLLLGQALAVLGGFDQQRVRKLLSRLEGWSYQLTLGGGLLGLIAVNGQNRVRGQIDDDRGCGGTDYHVFLLGIFQRLAGLRLRHRLCTWIHNDSSALATALVLAAEAATLVLATEAAAIAAISTTEETAAIAEATLLTAKATLLTAEAAMSLDVTLASAVVVSVTVTIRGFRVSRKRHR